MLEAQGVGKSFGARVALAGANLAIGRGEIVALLGASGSGKSTLVRALAFLAEPDAGRVLLDGAEPRDPVAARRRVGFVQQRPGLLRASARDNVAFPLRARGVGRADALARADAELARWGLAPLAGARAERLSGGEAQRVGLARALVGAPDALLLDEATNQLDPEWVRHAEERLRAERARGVAILLVTHSVAQARRVADRVALLDHGRIAEEGPASGTLAAPRTERLRAFVATS